MGRTKSWLALVLAIVMVLGMAVPTAFAAETNRGLVFTKKGTALTIANYQPTNNVGSSAGNAVQLYLGDDPVELDLYDKFGIGDSELSSRITSGILGLEPVISFPDTDPAVTLAKSGDGTISITPNAMTQGHIVVSVKVAQPEGKKFSSWWADSYFEQDIYVKVNPTATYTPKEINMDLQTSKVTHMLMPSEFTPNPADGKLVITSATPSGVQLTSQAVGNAFLLTAVTAGEYTVTVAYTVDGVNPGKTIVIPVHIGNSKANVDYKLWTSKDATGATFKRNADDATRTFQVAVHDYLGAVLRPNQTTNKPITDADLAAARFNFVPDSATSIVSFDGTNEGVITSNIGGTTQSATTTTAGDLVFVAEQNLISAKGKIVFSMNGVLSTSFPLEITALDFNTNLATNAVTIDLDKGLAADSTKKVAHIYPTSTDATSAKPLTDVTVIGVSNGVHTVSGLAVTKSGNNIQISAGNAVKGTYKLKVLGKVGGFWTAIKEFTVNVVDNTKVPVITANPTAIDLDLDSTLNPLKNKLDVTLTASNFIDQDANVDDEKGKGIITITGVTFDPALSGTAELNNGTANAAFTHTDITRVVKTNTATFTIRGAARYVGKMTLKGNVNGIAFEDLVIDVAAANKAAGTRDHIISDVVDNELSAKLSDASKIISASVVDFGGTKVPGTDGTIAAVSSDETVATVNAKDVNGKFTITYLKAGTTNITLTDTGAAPEAKSLVIKVTVGAMTFAVNPTSFVLDKKSADTSKVTLKLTSTEGTITNIGVAQTSGYAGFATPVIKEDADTIELQLTNNASIAKRQKLTVSANVNNTVATPVEITFEVKNTLVITPTLTSMAFELRDGGVRELPLSLNHNGTGAGLVVTSIEATPANLVTITGTSSPYTVKAGTTAGKGAIVVKGTVDGVAVEDVTIPVTVLGADEKPLLNVTPASLELSLLDGGKPTETLAVTSDYGDVTDVVITANPANLATISGTTITAKASGTGTLTVNAKVAGLDAEPHTVPFTVLGNVDPTGAGIYINGVKYASNDTLYIPNNWKAEKYIVTLVNADDAVITDVKASLTFTTGNKKARLKVKNDNELVPTDVYGKCNLTVTPKAGGTGTTIVLSVQRLPETDSSKVTLEREDPQAGTRGYFFDYMTTNPANAYFTQPKFWKFTSSNKTRANIKANGIIEFKKAGKVTLTASKKSNNGSKAGKLSIELNITDEYVETASWVAVLADSTNKGAEVLNVLNSQSYPKGTTKADAPYAYTAAGYDAMIKYLQDNAKETDVSAVYIGGTITKDGVELGDKTITLTKLAGDLAQVPGKIFLTLNGAGSMFYSSKDAAEATPADIAKVFAAVEAGIKSKTAVSDVGANMYWSSQKFYVLSATTKKSQSSVTAAKAAAVEDAFIAALTLKDGKFFNDDTTVTLKQLYNEIRNQSKKNIGYYPSAVKGVAVGYYTAVTP